MSVTVPSGVVEDMKNITGKGGVEWVGNDTYSAEVIKTNGTHGDVYGCMASNGVSNASHNFSLKVAGSPTILLVVQTSATSVIVEWSQPSGGATVTGYVVHYSDGDNMSNMTECNITENNMTDSNITKSNTTESSMIDSDMMESVYASSTRALITNLTECYNYTFSVEVTSEHLSGISKTFIFKLGTSDLSVNVTAEAVSSTVISVQWDHLRPCGPVSHLSVKFSVKYTAVPSEVINQTEELIVTSTEAMLTGLTPYTNYSITVAVVNEMGNVGPYSYPTTNQTLEDVPGPVGAVTASPSSSQVTLTWEPPLMPNGIIIAYEVSYRQTVSSEPETRVNSSALATNFTTESNLEEATEFIFSVRAYTRVGPGNATSLTVATLGAVSSLTLIKTAALLGIGSGVALIGIIIIGIAISWTVFKRSHHRAKPRLYTEDNPAYGVTLGVRYKPSRKTDSSPTHTEEPVYDTIS
ncbi:Protein sidekick-2 [Geodia barretti]|uniref:Protein sidekick-2 n=1 Tax=Geodia barretti TaxID=519541 RepID=A0AA35TWH7_GEOBA|nr:Protein sidekick-2 [Geodia barretti]